MTDSTTDSTNVNDNLEQLVAQYETGVAERETSDPLALLNTRSEIEAQWENLTEPQIERVEAADGTLIENAGTIASRLAASGAGSLRDLRAVTVRPPEQWWWYLDVLSHVSDYYGAETEVAKQPSSLFSRILTAVEVIVLIVAIFLLGRNLLPQIIPTPSPTPFPTWTPAPTETLNPQAFDMSSAATYKSQFNVIQMQVPKGWDTGTETTTGEYSFSYGQGTAQSVSLQILIGDPKTLYDQVLGITASVASPQAAFDAFKKNTPSGSNFQFGDVRSVKIGTLDGQGMSISIPAGTQRSDTEVDLQIAPLQDGKIVFIIIQAAKTVWDASKPILQKMLDSLVVSPQNIPTPTPTATPHPLRLTQTAVEQQIEALTPTPTPPATGPATAGATLAATAPSTSAATPTGSATATPAGATTAAATAQ